MSIKNENNKEQQKKVYFSTSSTKAKQNKQKKSSNIKLNYMRKNCWNVNIYILNFLLQKNNAFD